MTAARADDKGFLTTTEAAEAAGVSRSTMLDWCRRYDGLARRVGHRYRVIPAALDLLLEGKTLPEKDRNSDGKEEEPRLPF